MKIFMKPSHTLFLLFLLACQAPSPDSKQDDIKTPSTPAVTAEPSEGDFEGLPAHAQKEEFSDTPGIVRAYTLEGTNYGVFGTYQNGLREGNWIEYHPNGLVKSITPYVNGKMEGLRVEMSNNGVLEKRVTYHNNMRHGEYREYNYATIKEQRYYEYDKLEGVVKVFYPDGKLMEEGAYKNGTREGVSRWYDQNGNLSIEYEYKNGELVKK
jgi:antitoxin component YwqK of YwqJK toxin-antitoxin module